MPEKLKDYLSVDDQLSKLEDDGLVIRDRDEFYRFIKNNNYYRLTAYFHKIKGPDGKFPPDIQYEELVSIYKFDQLMRNNILFLLENIEIRTRAYVSDYLGREYGSDCFYTYKDKLVGDDKRLHKYELTSNAINCLDENNPVVGHHKNKYGGRYPIWVICQLLSFGQLSLFYSSWLYTDQDIISQEAFNIPKHYCQSWLYSLSTFRNICAHFNYLYLRVIAPLPEKGMTLRRYKIDNKTVFAILVVAKELSTQSNWGIFISKFMASFELFSCIKLNNYGFPENWETILNEFQFVEE